MTIVAAADESSSGNDEFPAGKPCPADSVVASFVSSLEERVESDFAAIWLAAIFGLEVPHEKWMAGPAIHRAESCAVLPSKTFGPFYWQYVEFKKQLDVCPAETKESSPQARDQSANGITCAWCARLAECTGQVNTKHIPPHSEEGERGETMLVAERN